MKEKSGRAGRSEQRVPDSLKSRVEHLLEQGIIERVGRGRGVRLLLSRRFYRHIGKAGVYTRKRGWTARRTRNCC